VPSFAVRLPFLVLCIDSMKLRPDRLCPTLMTALCLAVPLAAAAAPPHWEYRGAHGVAHWAELSPAYETCAQGRAQSPIDIRHAVAAPLPTLAFSYGRVRPSIVNNGHTIQVDVPPGQSLDVGGHRYELVQLHFHTPSEEHVDGKASAMVAHFVHRDADGKLAVVAALIRPGRPHPGFEAILSHLPAHAGETLSVDGLELDLAALLPAQRRYYDFDGSLTTPPCAEGVHWMVLAQPLTVSPAAIRRFRALYPANARPVQPLNGRVVRVSS
jgi:carbonic anhydrase